MLSQNRKNLSIPTSALYVTFIFTGTTSLVGATARNKTKLKKESCLWDRDVCGISIVCSAGRDSLTCLFVFCSWYENAQKDIFSVCYRVIVTKKVLISFINGPKWKKIFKLNASVNVLWYLIHYYFSESYLLCWKR